ncbi:MAG: M48 family metallopeptidase [Fibrobacteria bacterium]
MDASFSPGLFLAFSATNFPTVSPTIILTVFLSLFLTLFGLGLAVELFLNFLNRLEVVRHTTLPSRFSGPPFAGHFNQENYARSRSYSLERLSFDNVSLLYSAGLTGLLLFSGILPAFDHALSMAFTGGPQESLHHGVLFLAGVLFIQTLLKLPLSVWATFRIEGRYGFNTMTWGLFWRDLFKGATLSAALGVPFLYVVLALMRSFGSSWWLCAFGFLLVFQVVLMVVYPIFIAPLFNRFQPLEDGDLKQALLELAGRLRFPAGGIQVMDGSRRSLHSNAYFTGFGRFRLIVLYDTLLRQMERPELLGVLAHEIGHYQRRHIYKLMAMQILILGGLLFLASLALRWPPLYTAFGFDIHAYSGAGAETALLPPGTFAGNPAVGLFLFMTVFSILSIFFSPLRNRVSRRYEYEADAFAIEATGNAPAMQTALIKLSTQNLSNLTPHPWYSAFHYSHPTLAERLGALEQLRGNAA